MLRPGVGAREPGNELPGSSVGQAGRIAGAGASALGCTAVPTRSDGHLVYAGRQIIDAARRRCAGTAAAAALVFRGTAATAATAAYKVNDVGTFYQIGRRELAGLGGPGGMHGEITLLIHCACSRIDDSIGIARGVEVVGCTFRSDILRKCRGGRCRHTQ